MAIKISGTTVIDDSRNLTNIGTDGMNFPTSDGSAGQVLTTNGAGTLSFATLGGDSLKYNLVTVNTALVSNSSYRVVANTNVTLTLPASPTNGDTIQIVDNALAENGVTITVARNGNTIEGIADDLIVDIPYVDFTIWHDNTTWRLF